MKRLIAIFGGLVLLSVLCAAQDSSSASDQDSSQNLVAAARANRAQAQNEQAKQADIRELLKITNSGGTAVQSMDELEKSIRPLMTNALPSGEYRDRLIDLFFEKFHAKRDPAQLEALIVPVFDKYYTDDEIKQLIQLYQTPLGQKMLTVLPKVLAESQAAGKAWGEQLGRECMLEVLQEHPELRQQMELAAKNQPHQ